jgi:hypothetical protein
MASRGGADEFPPALRVGRQSFADWARYGLLVSKCASALAR